MKNKEISLSLRFAEIKVSKYSQFELEKHFNKENKPLVEFQSNFQFRVIEEEEKIACLIAVKLIIIETREEFASLQVENIFEINPLKEIIKSKSENSYEIPDSILHNLASISVSTVRGILSEKLKGTFAQNEIYPLVDPVSLFKGNK